MGQTEHISLLRELLLAVKTTIESSAQLDKQLSFKLFTVTLRAEASNQMATLRSEIDRVISLLTSKQGHTSAQGLYHDHAHQILEQLKVYILIILYCIISLKKHIFM